MNIVLFDHADIRTNLLPFTFTRPGALIRVGIDTISEKWKRHTGGAISHLTEPYLSGKFPAVFTEDNFFICGTVLPSVDLVNAIKSLQLGESLWSGNELLAYRIAEPLPTNEHTNRKEFSGTFTYIKNTWDIFSKNAEVLKKDFAEITRGRISQPVSSTVTVIGPREALFLEEGATAEVLAKTAAASQLRPCSAVRGCSNGELCQSQCSKAPAVPGMPAPVRPRPARASWPRSPGGLVPRGGCPEGAGGRHAGQGAGRGAACIRV